MHYLCDPAEVSLLCPGSNELLKAAYQKRWAIVVITNQSGIARGYFDWSDYERVTDWLLSLLRILAFIEGIYANMYRPDAPTGSWRKPRPAMLLEASSELNLDLKKSLLVGERLSDLEVGACADIQTLIKVLIGHRHSERDSIKTWAEQNQKAFGQNSQPDHAFLDSLVSFSTSLFGQSI